MGLGTGTGPLNMYPDFCDFFLILEVGAVGGEMPHLSSTAVHAWISQGVFAEAQIFPLLLQLLMDLARAG